MLRRSLLIAAVVLATTATACASVEPITSNAVLGVDAQAPPTTDVTVDDENASTTTTTTAPTGPATTGVVRIPVGGAPLASEPGGEPFVQAAQGIVMGFTERQGNWLEVVTTCNDVAWVDEAGVDVTPQAAASQAPGPGLDVAQAVIVLDPGHGDRDWGGVGPTGLAEKRVNLDIAERVRDLMGAPRAVDWTTGAITPGTDVPAFGEVWLTRDRSGPNDGDFELGLAFRAELANSAGADVLVSIHNNTVPRIDTDIPGTEVYYSIGVADSDRLASLIYEELLRSFSAYDADWTGGELLGARARVDPETDDDYYGLLRRAEMPAVIVEGVYIDQPDQEALLETEEFRQSYAEGVYRGIVRFLTTDETGTGIREPELFPDDAGTVNSSACVIPPQP
jgi:N-acetylmuramoyl-L-alanine amidase